MHNEKPYLRTFQKIGTETMENLNVIQRRFWEASPCNETDIPESTNPENNSTGWKDWNKAFSLQNHNYNR